MTARKKDTIEVQRAVYCARHGHSRVIHICFGQVTCGRCGAMLGDTLMGSYDTTDRVIVGHGGVACAGCLTVARTLTKQDRALLQEEAAECVAEMTKAGAA